MLDKHHGDLDVHGVHGVHGEHGDKMLIRDHIFINS